MPRARVTHVINSIGLGGVPEAAYQLLRCLRADFDQQLLVLRPLPAVPEPSRLGRLRRFEELDLPITFAPRSDCKANIASDIAELLARERGDLLHTHSYRPNLIARQAAAKLRSESLKLVAHYHNQYDSNWQRDGTLELDRCLVAFTDLAVACSEDVRRHVIDRLEFPADRVRVVPNGVDIVRFGAPIASSAARSFLELPAHVPIVGLVGRLSRQKGQDILIRAAALLRQSHPEVLVAFAGAPDTPDQIPMLSALAADLGIRDALRFMHFVDDMPRFYAAVDVIAAPSRWEGFGLMLVEAMAAGKPIVAASVGAIPEVTGDSGTAFLIAPESPTELADALQRVLSDPAHTTHMAARGRARAADFEWEQSGRMLASLYDEVLQGRLP